jgi:C_GCAxxG_C_C family probable redox protein
MTSNGSAIAGKAATKFQEGFNCSQAVCSALAPHFGVSEEVALRIGAAFGGGMGRMGEVCGAVTGAFMAIGLHRGNTVATDQAAKGETYMLVRVLADRFKEKHGTILCRELLDCDISTPEGYKQATEKGVFRSKCPYYVKDAAEIAQDILNIPEE